MALSFDKDGRMWVVQMNDYMPDTLGTGEDRPTGKIVILSDKDGDGLMDDRKVFLDSLVLPRAISLIENGILVAEPPNLWYYEIQNDKPSNKQLVDSAYAAGGNVELREGIKLCWVDLQPGIDSDEDIVSKYTSLFSDRTKVVQLTHVINWNGQVMPVEPIIKEAKRRGIEVILDGAHSFGKLETDMEKLGCDYFFTALHKWLSGPIPSSLLYVRKDKIAKMWPLASSINPQSNDIRKFEELSIQLYPNILALGFAIEYYHKIGRVTKEMRLRYLRRIWTNKLVNKEGLHFNTPLEEKGCCTIVNVALKGWEPKELEDHLLKANFIHVGIVSQPNMKGIRITPNIYTDPKQVDYFVESMSKVEPR